MSKCNCDWCKRVSPMIQKIRDSLDESMIVNFDYLMTRMMTAEEDLSCAEAKLDGSWPGWEWIKEARKPTTGVGKMEIIDLGMLPKPEWHNPENVTQGQLGEGYRFLVPWEVDGRHKGMAQMWFINRWSGTKGVGGTSRSDTYRVPASTPIPPKP